MKTYWTIKVTIVGALFLTCMLLSCASLTSGGTETGEARAAGVLYNPNGSCATHATVKIFRRNRSPRDNDVIYAMTVTDKNGVYRFDSLPSDTYNIFGSGDSGVSYLDSIVVNGVSSPLQLPADTLKAAGSIRGRIKLAAGDDPRTVLILFMGTNTWAIPDDSSGSFIVSNLAEGSYRIRFLTTLDNYLPKDTALSATTGKENTLPDPITLLYTGSELSAPTNLSIFFDTAHGCAKLTWNPVAASNCAGYVVYRNDTASSIPQRLNKNLVTDTFYSDTVFSDLMDTASFVFTYRIKAQDKEANLSATYSKPFTVDAPSPATIRTFTIYKFMNTLGDSASIGDTVSVIASYTNAAHKNLQVRWFIDNKDSLRRTSVVSALAGSDTLRIACRDSSQHGIYSAITDETDIVWWDSTTVTIVQDVPVANAGNDTAIPENGAIKLHGSAIQQFGTIVKWEWKIDSGTWSTTCNSDTTFDDPATKEAYVCSLAVTDDDGNRAVDGIKIAVVKGVLGIAAGSSYSFFLKADGTLWACGMNSSGQLGDGTRNDRPTPVQVMSDVQSMDAGVESFGQYAHSLILKNDKTLWACGSNMSARLGDGTTTDRYTPVQIMTDVKSMSVGEASHSLILKADGGLWACGSNTYGQLGDGTTTNHPLPVQVMTQVQSIGAGNGYSLILKTDGTLWACGKNNYGQLGYGTTNNQPSPVQVMTNVKSIKAGYYHSLILKTDNTLWASGLNNYGELGDGTTTSRSTPVQVMTDVKDMAAGYSHSLILKTDGTLWACGMNGYGELGDGTVTNRSTPVQVMTDVKSMSAGGLGISGAGGSHSLILRNDGIVWACGYNAFGQLGDGTSTSLLTPKIIILPMK
jgi:alpha-tubulin suppressor-like RCC1 family protein